MALEKRGSLGSCSCSTIRLTIASAARGSRVCALERSEWRTTFVIPAARASLPWTSPIAAPKAPRPISKTS